MTDGADDPGLRGAVRRAVGGALDATVGRVGGAVGEAALDVTGATAQQVIEELEPYLIEEAVPRIVDGITPYLIESVVPVVIDGVTAHLVDVTVPEVVGGVTEHLVEVTVPEVVEGVTPRLVEDLLPRLLDELRPYLEQDLVPGVVDSLLPELEQRIAPQLVEALMPKLREEVAPDLVAALMPKLRTEIAPDLVDALMPTIEQEVAPRVVEALLPQIQDQVAPQIIDAVMPKIRTEVVPTILDDIVDDPRLRDLIREQSQGLFLDALEALRENLADGDNLVEGVLRRLLRRQPRPMPESGLALCLEAASSGDAASSVTLRTLDDQRALWQSMPMPPAPPGREFATAGVVTRGLALLIDVSLTGWLISQGLSALISLLDSVFGQLPAWLTGSLTFVSISLVPLYLAVSWTWMGRSIGSWLVGTRVCTPDGRRPGFVRALVRAFLLVYGLVVWVATGLVAVFDRKRRTLLDLAMHTEERYLVPDTQQRRYLREQLIAQRGRPTAPAPEPPPVP